ncbi:hypothetical protein [Horticoccus sp. 23ND18S-11]|uniref:hypothetical protein n=1 Tax=Horticoccus sp. 23ND18S-11 TaxID=3391832 RepID=UPI0039C8FE86
MKTEKLERLGDFSSLSFEQPSVVSDGFHLKLLFDSKLPIVAGGKVSKLITAVRFKTAIACYFGLPNDEALSGHPLYEQGLEPYRAYEVRGSSWIAELSRRNAVHPNHRSDSFDEMHHYLFTFKDELFECVASGYELEVEGANEKSA